MRYRVFFFLSVAALATVLVAQSQQSRIYVRERSSRHDPQTAEIIKTFRERCPSLTVTAKPQNADFVVELEHEGGKDFFLRRNKIVVFDRHGDAFFSESTRSIGNAVKDACEAIKKRVP